MQDLLLTDQKAGKFPFGDQWDTRHENLSVIKANSWYLYA